MDAASKPIDDRKIQRVVELSGLNEDVAREYLFADWDNRDEHRAWLVSASPAEIVDWLLAVVPD